MNKEVTLPSGKTLRITAVNGDIDILAKSVNITAAQSDYESNYKYTYEQKGLTIALSVPVLNMMNAVMSTVNSAKNIGASKDDRINALAAANSGWAAYRLAQNAETIGNMASDLMKGNLGSDGAGGTSVGVSITYGQQKNVSTTHTEDNTAQSSEVNAGGQVNKGWDGWKLATALPSELLYAFYDKLNDSLFNGLLPLTNSEKLNQDVYLEAKAKNYTLDTSNHSRGGMTASVALQNLNIWREINDIPIRKARFYGTATNVQAYSNQLNKNGFTYQGKDGKTYQSGAYSAVHHSDGVGLIPVLLGGNSSTGGNCIFCYSHSSYFAEIPARYLKDLYGNVATDKAGSPIESKEYQEYKLVWGKIVIIIYLHLS